MIVNGKYFAKYLNYFILLSDHFNSLDSNGFLNMKNIMKCTEVNYDPHIPEVPFSRYVIDAMQKEGNNIAIVSLSL